MRVAQVTPVLAGRGGVQTYVRGLSGALADLGHHVEIFALGSPEQLMSGNTPGVKVHWFATQERSGWSRYGRQSTDAMVEALRSFEGLVHAHQPFSSTTAAAIRSGRPRVLSAHVHAPAYSGGTRGFRRRTQLRLVARNFDAMVFDSNGERDLYSLLAGRTSDEAVARPGLTRPHAVESSGDRGLIAIVGALAAHKRPDLALQAAIAVGRGAHCRIVGQGPLRPALVAMCEAASLCPDEILVGSVDDDVLSSLLAESKLIVAMSTEEAYGIALADGIAAGAFPLAANIPSHAEIVDLFELPASCLVPVEASVDTVARRIDEAFAAPALPTGRAAPSWSDAALALEALYKRVVRGRAL